MAVVLGVLVLVLVGSLIGSSHQRAIDRPTAAPTATITEPVVRTAPAVTLTATVTTTQLPDTEFDPLPLVAYGSGSKRTARFTTNRVFFEAAYTYDCSRVAAAPGFTAHLYREGDDVGPIADLRQMSGRGVAPLGNGIGTFYVMVETHCAWTIVIVRGDVPDFY